MMDQTAWNVKKGSTSIKDIPIYEQDGKTLITDLSTATAIVLEVKEAEKDAAAFFSLSLAAADIQVDTPSIGYLRVTIKPTVTDTLEIKKYYMGLKITWSATVIYEVIISIDDVITETFNCVQDIVS